MTTPPSDPFGTPPPGQPGEPDREGQPADGQPPAGQPYGQQPPAYPAMPPPPFPNGEAVPKPQPPSSILNAVRLMYVGAALSAFGFLVGLLTQDDIRDQIAEDNPDFTASEVDRAVTVGVVFTVVIGLIAVGLWVWMAETNRRGRKWARVVATVLGGLNIVLTLIGLTQNTGLGIVVNVVTIALAGAILWLLYRPESSQYYEAVSATPRF
jgi:hypothetical protein